MARAVRPKSLLFALVASETPPDEAIVKASIDLEKLGAEFVDPEESEGEPAREALWELHLELSGMVVRIAAERAPPLHAWHFEQPRWDEGERARAEGAAWAISTEAVLEDPPLRALRDQMQLALMLVPETPALFDGSSLRVSPPSSVRRLLESKAGLGTHELASLHSVAGKDRVWVHTHGLARAGVPELDALLVPRDAQGVVGELLNATASLLLEHGTPTTGKPFPVGTGIEVTLLRLDDALARIPPDAPGGRDSRDEEHREGERLVVAPADARGGSSPSLEPLVERASEGVFFRSYEATERMRVLSRERWGEFVRLFHESRGKPGFVFLVKLAYEPDRARERQEGLAREHLWFRVRSIEDDRIEAVLESSPLDIASLRKGDVRKHDLERLTEWLVIAPGGRLRPDSPG